jgi:CubicO group peptidase (beta-lactamase class C family)
MRSSAMSLPGALALSAFFAWSSSSSAQGAPTARVSSADSAAIDSAAARFFALNLAPGMAVVVVRGDEVVYLRGFGHADRETARPVTPETIFYIASTTKAFTGLTAAILDEKGRFELDAPLSKYLPALRLALPLSADSITIRSLLSHTHGIGGDGPVVWRTAYTGEFESNDELLRLLAEHPPASGGRAYAYGNIGYNVAGFTLDVALRRSWKDLLAQEIFTPLGMSSTTAYVSRAPAGQLAMPYSFEGSGFQRLPYGKTDANMQAAGGLVSSARDMARWLEAQLNQGRVDGKQALPRAAVAEAQRLQASTDINQRGMRQIGYSLGWQMVTRGTDTMYTHGGGFPGFATHVSFLPSQKLGVAVMANEGNLGGPLVDLVASAIYQRLAGGAIPGFNSFEEIESRIAQAKNGVAADRARRAARSQVLPLPIERYAGVFVDPIYGTIDLSVVDGRLYSRAGAAQAPVEVFDAEKSQLRFALTGSGAVVPVEVVDGQVVAFTYQGRRFRRR